MSPVSDLIAERVCFEIISPPKNWDTEKVSHWAGRVAAILSRYGLTRLNLPEVVDEARTGRRTVQFFPKMDHVSFGQLVKERFPEVVLIPNKISVRVPKDTFTDWVHTIYEQGIRHMVVVGGESSKVEYPGWSVPEAAAFIREHFPLMRVGGITIFTRSHEAERIVAKVKHGIDFFFSQIVFETANLKQVLTRLTRLCEDEGLKYPDVYISLAPAATIREIEFMRWLGVEFPSAVLSYLTDRDEAGLEARANEVQVRVLDEIFNFMYTEGLRLGFNVEHVVYKNLELAERLVEEIERRMKR